jgi:hypothetical protein
LSGRRPPKRRPISGKERDVSFLARYIRSWRVAHDRSGRAAATAGRRGHVVVAPHHLQDVVDTDTGGLWPPGRDRAAPGRPRLDGHGRGSSSWRRD